MNNLVRRLKNGSISLWFTFIFLFSGLVVGLILGFFKGDVLKSDLLYYAEHISGLSFDFVLSQFAILTSLGLFSYFLIGIFFFIVILFLVWLYVGFILGSFICLFGLSGLLFGLLFLFLLFGPFLIILCYIFPLCLKAFRQKVKMILDHGDGEHELCFLIRKFLHVFLFFWFVSLVLMVFSKPILEFFRFLIS